MDRTLPDRGHVLFADDNEDFRDLLTEGLKLLGFRVDAFPHGEKLRQAIAAAEPPFVVVTDLLMPAASGYEVIEFLREQDLIERVPVVVLSAVSNPDVGRGVLVIEKPVDLDQLAKALDVQVKLAGRWAEDAKTQLRRLRASGRRTG